MSLILLLTLSSLANEGGETELSVEGTAEEEAAEEEAIPETWDLLDIPGQIRPGAPNWDLEVLYHEARYSEGLELSKQRIAENPTDPELYWHGARFMFEVAERVDRTDTSMDKEAWYQGMLSMAEAGLALDPDHAHLLFAKGIALGRYGTTRGVLASLFLAEPIEDAWTTCANSGYQYRSLAGEEQLPCDCYLTLGIFYRLVPDSIIVEWIAGTRGDLGESLAWLQRADECDPDDIGIEKELGVTQTCIGTKNKDQAMIQAGRETLAHMVNLTPRSPNEAVDIGHGRMLLANPKLACEYSRDGQQDLDEDKLQQSTVENP